MRVKFHFNHGIPNPKFGTFFPNYELLDRSAAKFYKKVEVFNRKFAIFFRKPGIMNRDDGEESFEVL